MAQVYQIAVITPEKMVADQLFFQFSEGASGLINRRLCMIEQVMALNFNIQEVCERNTDELLPFECYTDCTASVFFSMWRTAFWIFS